MQDDFFINGQLIKRGEQITTKIELPSLFNTPMKMPVKVLRGKKEGSTVFVSAAIHGNELNGVEIIRKLLSLQILKKLSGTLILIPVVNVYGFNSLSRYMPDRRDLNRSFPGSLKGSLTSRVAKIFLDEIVSKCDYGIDLHTASIHKSNLPQIRVNIENDEILELAKSFEAPMVLDSPLRDGSLRANAKEFGTQILLYEAGEALRFDKKSIEIGVKGVVNVLRKLNMLPSKKRKSKKREPEVSYSSSWIRANESGLIRTLKKLGDSVEKDEVIALIEAPLEGCDFQLRASFKGIIIGKTQIPLVQEGDAVFHVAKFEDIEKAEEHIEYFHEEILQEDVFNILESEI